MARPTCPTCGFVQFRNPALAVAVLVAAADRVLLGRRSGSPGAGKWALPSGYIEYDEDFLSGARREVREEMGLEVWLQAIVHVESAFLSPRDHFLTVYLLAEPSGGALRAGDDVVEVAWFPGIGPLPEMAFVQDEALIAAYVAGKLPGMPVDPGFAQ
jgi:ADP-ribose pyrophosphatase YjhB (NUDIX family)